jgi:DNA replication protein DnaC
MNTTRKPCQICSRPFDAAEIRILGVTVTAQVCEACDHVAQEAWDKRKRDIANMNPDKPKSRAELFKAIAEGSGFGRFLDFDICECRNVGPLQYGQGMLLHGSTGRGKTYLAVERARIAFMEHETVALVDSIEFGLAVSGLDGDKRDAMLERCCKPQWLVFDDLLKKKTTDRVAEGLFHIANQRENRGRHTIWTTNANDAQLRANLEAGYAEPFLERLYRTSKVFTI